MFARSNNSYDFPNGEGCESLYYDTNPLYAISKLIPDGAKILDVGAGNGVLSRLLKEMRSGFTIDGIETNAYAAELSRQHYRRFYVGEAQDFLDEIHKERYDYIVLADVIEHLSDPLEFLKELCLCMSATSKIIMSLPNIAFGAIRLSLLNGNFDYVDSGILERTHLRFFTLKTLESLVENSGLNLEKIFFLQRSLFGSEIQIESLNLNPLLFYRANKDPLLFTYQFVVALTKESCFTEKIYVGEKDKFPFLKYLVRRHKKCAAIKSLSFLYRLGKESK